MINFCAKVANGELAVLKAATVQLLAAQVSDSEDGGGESDEDSEGELDSEGESEEDGKSRMQSDDSGDVKGPAVKKQRH